MAYVNISETVPRREYRQVERKYVVQYVALAYPDKPAWFNLRVGPPPEEIARMYPGVNMDRAARVWKKFVDAVVLNDVEFVLIEAKIRRPVESVGEIMAYRDQLWETPELRPYGKLPIRAIMVCPSVDPSLSSSFRAINVEVQTYAPGWVISYLQEVNK